MPASPSIDFGAIVENIRLALFVFRGTHLLYQNVAAATLRTRLTAEYQVDLLVILRDHLLGVRGRPEEAPPAVTLLTAARGEPFYVHVTPLRGIGGRRHLAVTVRELGIEREAFARRYSLSRREAEVAELILRGYGTADISTSLGIAVTTTKRHLSRIFDKVGVDSRTQLISRLA